MGATSLTYNGVTIFNGELVEFSQVGVRDDLGGADRIYDRITVRIRGMIHLSPLTIHGTSVEGTTLGDRMQQVQYQMLEHRKPFSLSFENTGEPALFCQPHEESYIGLDEIDVCNGPHPVEFKILKVVSNLTLKIEFAVELHMVTCQTITNPDGVLSNRWSMGDMIDKDWFSTRVIRGRLKVTSTNLSPHAFRHLIMPPLQTGFKRVLIDCNTTPDGLNLDYTIVDRQIKSAAPFPATSWAGQHSISTLQNGIMTQIMINVTLWAPPDVTKTALISLAAKIAADKTNYEAANAGDLVIIDDLTFTDIISEHENAVNMNLVLRKSGPGQVASIGAIDTSKIGTELSLPGYDPKKARIPPLFGAANTTGLWVSYLQEPCGDQHSLDGNVATNSPDNGGSEGNDGTKVTTDTSETLPETTMPWSQDHKEAPYTHYQVDARYDTNDMRAQMAVGASGGSSGSGDTTVTSTIVKLTRGPVGRKIIRVEAERIGQVPKIPPALDFTDENGILHYSMGTKVAIAAPELAADGYHYHHSVTIEYIYAMTKTVGTGSHATGALPWLTNALGAMSYPASSLFQTGIA